MLPADTRDSEILDAEGLLHAGWVRVLRAVKLLQDPVKLVQSEHDGG